MLYMFEMLAMSALLKLL